MTIRGRNRLIFSSFIFSLIIFAVYLWLTILQISKGVITEPDVTRSNFYQPQSILTQYSTYIYLFSLLYETLFSCVIFRVLITGFEKTQSPNLIYFALFAVSLVFDSFRILIPLFYIQNSMSQEIFVIGRIEVFSRFLGILSLLATNLLNDEDKRQDTNKNCFIIIVVSLFFASFIPLNTTNLLLDYQVIFAYSNILTTIAILTVFVSIITMFMYNNDRDYKQTTTIGFAILSIGYIHFIINTTVFSKLLGITCLTAGTYIYMKELHNQYLLND